MVQCDTKHIIVRNVEIETNNFKSSVTRVGIISYTLRINMYPSSCEGIESKTIHIKRLYTNSEVDKMNYDTYNLLKCVKLVKM